MSRPGYREYMLSAHWQGMRSAVLERDEYRCRACDGEHSLECHHRWYPNDPYAVRVEDLTTLCRGCHRAIHGELNRRSRWSFWSWLWPYRRSSSISPWVAYRMMRRMF